MGIVANNYIVVGKPSDAVDANTALTKAENYINTQSVDHPAIVVDGKVRKITKKSAYLLDMLSLDE
jgi:hypothetical protein